MYDVLIIGAGVCGTLTARELTKRGCKVLFVDKGPDAASGASAAPTPVSFTRVLMRRTERSRRA